MFQPITDLFTMVIEACHNSCAGFLGDPASWWISIILFTVITKIVLMPISLWVQKNEIMMLSFMPKIFDIKVEHFGDKETIGEKQRQLYKEKHYHPAVSLVPLLIQIVILLGLVGSIATIASTLGETSVLGRIPMHEGGFLLLSPVFAGVSAYVLGYAQGKLNPLQKEQPRNEQLALRMISIMFSCVLGLFVSCGIAFYWICSNLMAILVQLACNALMPARKYIDYEEMETARSRYEAHVAKFRENTANKHSCGYERSTRLSFGEKLELLKRESADIRSFSRIRGKHLVFYSQGMGFYRLFKSTIEWLVSKSDMTIHYITNDPFDPVFAEADKLAGISPEGRCSGRLRAYYVSEKRAIPLMMKMDADMVVTSLEDFGTDYIKCSKTRDDISYLFMFHHMTSCHLTPTPTAFDHFNTILCVGPHQIAELERIRKIKGLPQAELVKCGYPLLDDEISGYSDWMKKNTNRNSDDCCTILLAPSWQANNILDLCLDEFLNSIETFAEKLPEGKKCRLIVRPHPEYVRRSPERWARVVSSFAAHVKIAISPDTDFSNATSIWSADILVTDWSSIACEFSFTTLKPCLFIDTPMKLANPQWKKIELEPSDFFLRNQIGTSVSLADDGLNKRVVTTLESLFSSASEWEKKIADVREEFVFNLSNSAAIAGEYMLSKLISKQDEHKDLTNLPN